ncbi:hypothetical protein [Fusibacter ferrireducens]|uniref:Uncharacterized protein n=1 Tax=Fusibacter ferrireducens TaxID=2785058 RepID=A0ABR9ZZP1_9FIRM|nr:hypothetical protein [Fusibacter ferrireducens]MBF4695917.1 hypothetical protein [Fusibacter ferrireducens]
MNLMLFEHVSIPEGLKFTDFAIKNYQVTLEKHDIRCPGRYVCLLSGSEANLKNLSTLIAQKESLKFLDVKCLYHLEETILSRTNESMEPEDGDDLLAVETKHLIDGYYVLDLLIKRTQINQFSILSRLGLFGKGIILLSGKSNSIQMANAILGEDEIAVLVKSAEIIPKSSLEKVML